MKTFQIEDAKTRFFTDKENYLNFKQAWKDFHNSELLVEWKDKDISPWDHPRNADRILARTKYPALNSGHYMLYNILRGYETSRGFSPLVNPGRLGANGGNPLAAQTESAEYIIRTARYLKNINSDSSSSRRYAREAIAELLLPFGGTISNQVLYDIAAELYLNITEKEFPAFVVEEIREIEEQKPKAKLKRKLFSWGS